MLEKSRSTESLLSSAECFHHPKLLPERPLSCLGELTTCPLFKTQLEYFVNQTRCCYLEERGNKCALSFQSVENRSPAEGSGARPPVTLGRRERSGRLWMWDFSSFLTWVTLANFCLYSCKWQNNTLNPISAVCGFKIKQAQLSNNGAQLLI